MGFDIRRLSIFANLQEERVELLKRLAEAVAYEAGEEVIRQGDHAEYFYIIRKGKVQISFKPYDGNPITVSHVGAGELFGWSAVIGSEKYTSTGIVIEPLEAIRIRGDELRKLIRKDPEAGQAILNSLASAISTRWKDAREQVRLILENGMK